jgi:single-strand DNA-binding protein
MRGLNRAMLIGNLGADPEIRSSQNGQTIATLRLATTDTWQDKQGGRTEKTEWHRIVAFGRLAEIARDYMRKGHRLYVEGRIQTRNWQDQQGQTRYTTEIVALSVLMLSARGEGESGGGGGGGGGSYGSRQGAASPDEQPGPDYDEMGPIGAGEDSDLPF